MKIPIAEIGEEQMEDVLKSSGHSLSDGVGRICTVVKPKMSFDDRGDKSPLRMARLFGGKWEDYNNHYIIQAAGCPLKCPYCYVDNFKADREMGTEEVVDDFASHLRQSWKCGLPWVNVLHLMGGAPGRYPEFWRGLRGEMDEWARYEWKGFDKKILFSDVIFVENHFYGVRPWEHMNLHHFMLTGCLKGTNRKNFLENTGKDLFDVALKELERYAKHDNFYLSLINYDERDLPRVLSIVPEERIDFLKVVNYNVTKKRMAGAIK